MSRQGVNGDFSTAESSSLTSTSTPQTNWRVWGNNITHNNDHNNRSNGASFQSSHLLNSGVGWQQDWSRVNATRLIQSLRSAGRQKHTWGTMSGILNACFFFPRDALLSCPQSVRKQHLQNHKKPTHKSRQQTFPPQLPLMFVRCLSILLMETMKGGVCGFSFVHF